MRQHTQRRGWFLSTRFVSCPLLSRASGKARALSPTLKTEVTRRHEPIVRVASGRKTYIAMPLYISRSDKQ